LKLDTFKILVFLPKLSQATLSMWMSILHDRSIMRKHLIFAMVLATLSISSVVSAVPDSVVTGPYNVSFDIGLTRNDYNVTMPTPKATESLSGDKLTEYSIIIMNYSGSYRFIEIKIRHLEGAKVSTAMNGADFVEYLDSLYKNDPSISWFQSSTRTIDNSSGGIAQMKVIIDSKHIVEGYEAYYQTVLDPNTAVRIASFYPWDEGTLKLLKTIHVKQTKGV
jgi:hypothetical protein